MSNIPEKILIYKLTTKKDTDSFGILYDLYVEKIYRFIYFKVGNKQEAEDLTSEVFLKVWNHISEDKKIKSFSGLLYKIARNMVIDLYRSKARDVQYLDSQTDLPDEGKWFEKMLIKAEAKQILENLEKLKQEYKEVVTLRYVDELKIEEIADIMDKKNVAIRVMLHRALKKLKELSEEK